jgi:type IV secretory pathway TraG/TraD family ATPase VirD4
MNTSPNWGPSHQTTRRPRTPRHKLAIRAVGALVLLGVIDPGSGQTQQILTGLIALAVLVWVAVRIGTQLRSFGPVRRLRQSRPASPSHVGGGDPLQMVRGAALRQGSGVYLGQRPDGGARYSRSERAVLVLGPPRSGKTSAVIIPTLIAHTGPAVSTSTKPDVARATLAARSRQGRAWTFDPTASAGGSRAGGHALRWSPVQTSGSWDGALLMARAMTSRIGQGTTDRSHWATRAQALLAPMLHAAAIHHRDMSQVVDWVTGHELDQAGVLLEDERCSRLAFGSLLGILHTEARERSSIFSATADALQAYSSQHALNAAQDPNFDPDAFVRSADTIYIHAPAEHQAAAAPIVCGLLAEIRRATYHAHATRASIQGRMLFALDEVANIAPLEELPQIASEAGGQGLILLAALQDLSQARQRWGAAADGFLTLFGTKLMLPGIADQTTLEAVSVMLGEYDRQLVSHTTPQVTAIDLMLSMGRSQPRAHRSATRSTQRTRVLSPGEIANLPTGHALHLDQVRWELLALTPAHQTEPWRTLTTSG